MARSESDEFGPPPSTSIEELVRALQNPDLFDHPVKSFSLIETHISWVLLTGHFAYKFKKPVKFGFIDFSTLEKRKHYCTEELRLNRRFAPELYLQVLRTPYGGFSFSLQNSEAQLLSNLVLECHLGKKGDISLPMVAFQNAP